jgi:hypothetical protein
MPAAVTGGVTVTGICAVTFGILFMTLSSGALYYTFNPTGNPVYWNLAPITANVIQRACTSTNNQIAFANTATNTLYTLNFGSAYPAPHLLSSYNQETLPSGIGTLSCIDYYCQRPDASHATQITNLMIGTTNQYLYAAQGTTLKVSADADLQLSASKTLTLDSLQIYTRAPTNYDGGSGTPMGRFPFIQSGTTASQTGGSGSIAVGFNQVYTANPIVIVTPVTTTTGNLTITVGGISTSGFTIYWTNGTQSGTFPFNWVAFGN